MDALCLDEKLNIEIFPFPLAVAKFMLFFFSAEVVAQFKFTLVVLPSEVQIVAGKLWNMK